MRKEKNTLPDQRQGTEALNDENSNVDEGVEKAVFDFIQQARYVTYVDIQRRFGCGEFGIYLQNLNIILWGGLKKTTCNALVSLKEQGRIKDTPCDVLGYILDGRVMIYPVVIKAPPKGGFKSLCWLPCIIEVGDCSPDKNLSYFRKEA